MPEHKKYELLHDEVTALRQLVRHVNLFPSSQYTIMWNALLEGIGDRLGIMVETISSIDNLPSEYITAVPLSEDNSKDGEE